MGGAAKMKPLLLWDEKKMQQTIAMLREFKEMNPWKGSVEERKAKFEWLYESLNNIYGRQTKLSIEVPNNIKEWYSSGGSYYSRVSDTVHLRGRLSVITALHEYAHALGGNEVAAYCWSNYLFRTVWPEKAVKLKPMGALMVVDRSGGKGDEGAVGRSNSLASRGTPSSPPHKRSTPSLPLSLFPSYPIVGIDRA
jgi:hypothetical protein